MPPHGKEGSIPFRLPARAFGGQRSKLTSFRACTYKNVFQNDWSLLKQRIAQARLKERLVDLGVTFVRRSDVDHGASWFVGRPWLIAGPRREADRGAFDTAPARPCRSDRNG